MLPCVQLQRHLVVQSQDGCFGVQIGFQQIAKVSLSHEPDFPSMICSVILHQNISCQASAQYILNERSEDYPVKSFGRDLKQVSAPASAEAPTLPGQYVC